MLNFKYPQKSNGGGRKPKLIRYIVDEKTGCWNWQLQKQPDGYGRLWKGKKGWMAHRYYYTQKYGKIPDGLSIDHMCNNPSCVNPDHLEAKPIAENIRRTQKKIKKVGKWIPRTILSVPEGIKTGL